MIKIYQSYLKIELNRKDNEYYIKFDEWFKSNRVHLEQDVSVFQPLASVKI